MTDTLILLDCQIKKNNRISIGENNFFRIGNDEYFLVDKNYQNFTFL
jgi:hypothetical protein